MNALRERQIENPGRSERDHETREKEKESALSKDDADPGSVSSAIGARHEGLRTHAVAPAEHHEEKHQNACNARCGEFGFAVSSEKEYVREADQLLEHEAGKERHGAPEDRLGAQRIF